MAKILLVEDDKSLREIYAVRLQAEGYEIVTANDGEQALAVAIKERPVLIITDVMMPKISGFDMLDILRSTTETKDIKVVMMTALSSDDQRNRGEQIGADRYLVKSQVGIEDVVRTVHEILGDKPAQPAAPVAPAPTPGGPAPVAPQAPPQTTAQIEPAPSPVTATPPPAGPQVGFSAPTQPISPAQQPQNPPHTAATQPAPRPAAPPQPGTPPAPPPPLPPAASSAPATPSSRQRVIQPLNDPHAKIDISELLDKELAKEAGLDIANRPQVATTAQEKALVDTQIQQAGAQPEPQPATPPAPQPTPANPAPSAPQPPATPAAPPARPTPPPPQRVFDITPPRPQ